MLIESGLMKTGLTGPWLRFNRSCMQNKLRHMTVAIAIRARVAYDQRFLDGVPPKPRIPWTSFESAAKLPYHLSYFNVFYVFNRYVEDFPSGGRGDRD